MTSRNSRALAAALVAGALVASAAGAARAQFTYRPAGELVPGSGRGRVDGTVYAPGIRFPIEAAPAYLNSQVWGVGGSAGRPGSQCDAANRSYPWHDNYCESRSWSMPMCPSGVGHQGQDIRAATCADRTHDAVATVAGTITHIGAYSVYLTGDDGRRYDYLHLRDLVVRAGARVAKGARIGRVSNNFGSTATTIHLHFNLRMTVSGFGTVYAPTYMSLVRSYESLLGVSACTPRCEGTEIISADCGRGNCAAYGATCTTDLLGTRCVYAACPPRGTADVCLDADTSARCVEGLPASTGECGAFAAYCSTAGRTPTTARCVSAFCVASPEEAPVAHDGCWIEGGQLAHCDAEGGITFERCPAGQACTTIPEGTRDTPHCAPAVCPATGDVTQCVNDRYIARCFGGSVVSAGDCGAFAAYCSTVSAGGAVAPRCVSAFCVGSASEVPRERDTCLPDGTIAHCTAEGGITDAMDCPAGTVCTARDGTAACEVATDPGAPSGDAGPTRDAGTVRDAGPTPHDAGRSAPKTLGSGCGCRAAGRDGGEGHRGAGLALLIGLLLAWRRTTRRRTAR
jgi:MYXO-CTERM domain-containing protein